MSEAGAPDRGRVIAFVGLGSNLGDPASQVRTAADELNRMPRSRLLALSRLYRSRPLGPPDQPDYINAVAKLETGLPPDRLLDELQDIESRRGRVRGVRWGPRGLDLDILLYGARTIATRRLSVPHPGIPDRSFVLWPLADLLDETTELPGLGRLGVLMDGCPEGGIEACPGDASETP